MHASIEQLISLRDREPVDARVATHMKGCRECQGRLADVRDCQTALQQLPLLEPSPAVYAAVRQQLDRGATAGKRLAVAATVAAAALLVFAWMSISVRLNSAVEGAGQQFAGQGAHGSVRSGAMNAATTELIRRSQALESVFAQMAEFPTDRPSESTAMALNALQDRLALLDYGLNQSQLDPQVQEQIQQLWQRRVDTLQSMVGVQQAELARQGYHGFQVLPASRLDDDVIRW